MYQPLSFIHPGAKIAKNVVVEPFSSIDNNVIIGQGTWIGSNVTIMSGARIGKNCSIFPGSVISAVPQDLKFNGEDTTAVIGDHVTVGSHVILAGMVAVHHFCSIGNHAFVAGGSLVRKDVPPFVKAAREPISYVGINSVGLRRRGFSSKVIMDIQSIYRTLYQKKYNNTQAVKIIEGEMEATKERDEIIQFIQNSQRGIMKGYFQN